MYELLVCIAGAIAVCYVAAQWIIYFVQIQSWQGLIVSIAIIFLTSAGLWLKVRWVVYLLAAAIGIGSALMFSGYFSVLLPEW